MKYCTKCGNEITNEKPFCTCCGNDLRNKTHNKTNEPNKINETESGENATLGTTAPVQNYTPSFKFSKISKIAIVIFIILIISTVAIIKVGNSLSDPNKLVTRFEKDVASNNTSDLAKILYSSDSRLKVDSKNISPLLSYFKSTPEYFNQAIQNLKDDAISPKDIKNLNLTSGNTLTLANDGKNFLIFPKYKINIKPSFIKVISSIKDVTLSINNTQVGKSDTDKSTKEFGPYIPGNYSVLANYKGKYVTLSKPYPVDLIATANGIAEISVFDDMRYINISSDYPNAKIYVDGKDVNVYVKDATQFGPINNSSKIYATYVEDGKTLKSIEYSITSGDTDLFLSFENSTSGLSDVKTQLKDLLWNYASYFVLAINTNNISLIDPYVTSGSGLYNAQRSYIPRTYAAGIQENIISTDITNYNISDDNKSGSITSSEVYNIIAKDGTSSNKICNFVYGFKYNDSTSSYKLTSITKAQ